MKILKSLTLSAKFVIERIPKRIGKNHVRVSELVNYAGFEL
jgi:hypothetical protein